MSTALPRESRGNAKPAAKPVKSATPTASRAVGNHVVHLSDPEMKDTLAELKRRIKEEPGFKRSLLESAGIVNAKGKLTKLYGGR